MSKIISIFAAVVCAFAFTGTVLAEDAAPAVTPAAATQAAPAKHAKTSIVSGAVVSIDATAKQLVVKNSEGKMADVTFDVNENTNIRKAGKDITLSDIAAGDKVMVAFKHKDDKRIATSIKVRTPKAAAATPPAQ
jgi:Cu/Ag efflux protein CusF